LNIDVIITSLVINFHLICGIVIFIFMCFTFPKEARKKDPNWWYNNIWNMLTTSFAIGGFITLCIGLSLLGINGVWPSQYIPPNTITTSIFMIVIYLLALGYYNWKSYAVSIEEKYGMPRATDKQKSKSKLKMQKEKKT